MIGAGVFGAGLLLAFVCVRREHVRDYSDTLLDAGWRLPYRCIRIVCGIGNGSKYRTEVCCCCSVAALRAGHVQDAWIW